MKDSESATKRHYSSSDTHRRVQASTTLNRKYVRRPTSLRETPKISSISTHQAEVMERRRKIAERLNRERLAAMQQKRKATQAPAQKVEMKKPKEKIEPAKMHQMQRNAISRMSPRQKAATRPVPMSEKKNEAIKSALRSVSTMEAKDKKAVFKHIKPRRTFSTKKIVLALACATASVAAIGYFVSLSMPDVSVRVAAMQTGIEASYPAYIPRDYSLSNITSEEGKLSMTFSNADKSSFTLTEEKSSWDSSALETNYAKKAWENNYTTLREQGITIFISNSSAAWVNGGVFYKLTSQGASLTKKQIKSIATSL